MKVDPDAKKQNRTLLNTIEHHGNRLYGFMGLWSKMCGWMWIGDTLQTVMTTKAPAVLTIVY